MNNSSWLFNIAEISEDLFKIIAFEKHQLSKGRLDINQTKTLAWKVSHKPKQKFLPFEELEHSLSVGITKSL